MIIGLCIWASLIIWNGRQLGPAQAGFSSHTLRPCLRWALRRRVHIFTSSIFTLPTPSRNPSYLPPFISPCSSSLFSPLARIVWSCKSYYRAMRRFGVPSAPLRGQILIQVHCGRLSAIGNQKFSCVSNPCYIGYMV